MLAFKLKKSWLVNWWPNYGFLLIVFRNKWDIRVFVSEMGGGGWGGGGGGGGLVQQSVNAGECFSDCLDFQMFFFRPHWIIRLSRKMVKNQAFGREIIAHVRTRAKWVTSYVYHMVERIFVFYAIKNLQKHMIREVDHMEQENAGEVPYRSKINVTPKGVK